ncbi:MAG: glycosyltransferase family 4 protein [Chloroflexi bacterium]|nr:glycosyltransferase family 4 protein [Chloroflexota bacterium]
MKICLLCYRGKPNCGGQGVYIYYLSRELTRIGHEVHVISGPPYPVVEDEITLHKLDSLNLYDSLDRFPKDFPWRRPTPLNLYEYGCVALGLFPEPMTFSLRAFQKIKELQPIHKFDVIHDNQGLGHGMLLMKHLLKIPVVATIHHPVTVDRDLDLAAAPSWRWKLRLKRWYSFIGMQSFVAKRMDRVITVSKKSAEDISRDFGVPMSKMRVVYNGTDGNLFKQNGNVVKEPNSLITVNSGDSPIKGVEYLLKAMKLLRNGIVPKLTIVGCAVPGGRNFNMVQEYGLEDIVTFTGRIDDDELVARYTSSEIAVVPSLYEGFGFPATEAMACGLPVIASNAGALPELLGLDSKVGISVPPADAEALAAAIKQLMHDKDARKTMGAAGRKRVESHFNWRTAAEQTVAVYRELM